MTAPTDPHEPTRRDPTTPTGRTDLGDAARDETGAPPRSGRRFGVSAAVAASGLVLGGIGVAGLAGASPTDTSPAAGATPSTEATPDGTTGERRHGPGRHGGMLGGIDGQAVHGEIVVETEDGFVTVQTQRGEVTAVSDSSITLESADGFTATYAIDDDTTFGRSTEGISGIDEGDTIRVVGSETDGELTALSVRSGAGRGGAGSPDGNGGRPAPTASPDATASADA